MKLNDLNMNELRAETDTKPNLYTSFAAAALIITDLIVFLLNHETRSQFCIHTRVSVSFVMHILLC